MKNKFFILLSVAFLTLYPSKNYSIATDLPNLEKGDKLNLSDQGITGLEDLNEIEHIEKVKFLDLSSNEIPIVPDKVFDKLTNLKWLSLSKNRITTLPPHIFDQLTNLFSLNLSFNRIQTLQDNIFDKLTNLKWLHLNINQIKELPDKVFDNLTKLKELSIGTFYPNFEVLFKNLLNLEKLTIDFSTQQQKNKIEKFFDNRGQKVEIIVYTKEDFPTTDLTSLYEDLTALTKDLSNLSRLLS